MLKKMFEIKEHRFFLFDRACKSVFKKPRQEKSSVFTCGFRFRNSINFLKLHNQANCLKSVMSRHKLLSLKLLGLVLWGEFRVDYFKIKAFHLKPKFLAINELFSMVFLYFLHISIHSFYTNWTIQWNTYHTYTSHELSNTSNK